MIKDPELQWLLSNIGVSLAFTAPGIGAAWVGKMRDVVYRDDSVADVQVTAKGVAVNLGATQALSPGQLMFKVANQTMKVALDHGGLAVQLGLLTADGKKLGTKKDWQALGLAEDLVVNTPLVKDRIGTPPADAILMANLGERLKADAPDYDGRFETAELYYHISQWLKEDENDDEDPNDDPGGGNGQGEGDGEGKDPGQGDNPATGEGNAAEGTMNMTAGEKAEMREMMASIGKGSAVAEALLPPPVRSSFEKVIRAGAEQASLTASSRVERSYSRMSRRVNSLDPDITLPGQIGTEASLCVIMDASGSVGAEAVARCVAHVLKVQKSFPGMRCYFITHTSGVDWQGWLKPGGDAVALTEAAGYTGGTDDTAAYVAACENAPKGKFDTLIHFTDGELSGEWPTPPARRFVVGLCGRAGLDPDNIMRKPPEGTKIVPVAEGED